MFSIYTTGPLVSKRRSNFTTTSLLVKSTSDSYVDHTSGLLSTQSPLFKAESYAKMDTYSVYWEHLLEGRPNSVTVPFLEFSS